jgi:trimeric autotransporter adhesin
MRVRLEMHGPAAGGKMARFSSRQISLGPSQAAANAFFAIPGGAAAFLDGSIVASLLGADAATVIDQKHISLQAIMHNLQSGVEATVCKWWSLPAAAAASSSTAEERGPCLRLRLHAWPAVLMGVQTPAQYSTDLEESTDMESSFEDSCCDPVNRCSTLMNSQVLNSAQHAMPPPPPLALTSAAQPKSSSSGQQRRQRRADLAALRQSSHRQSTDSRANRLQEVLRSVDAMNSVTADVSATVAASAAVAAAAAAAAVVSSGGTKPQAQSFPAECSLVTAVVTQQQQHKADADATAAAASNATTTAAETAACSHTPLTATAAAETAACSHTPLAVAAVAAATAAEVEALTPVAAVRRASKWKARERPVTRCRASLSHLKVQQQQLDEIPAVAVPIEGAESRTTDSCSSHVKESSTSDCTSSAAEYSTAIDCTQQLNKSVVLSTATADISTSSSSSSLQQQDAPSAIADDAACNDIAEQLDVVGLTDRTAAAVMRNTAVAESEPLDSYDSDGVAAAAVSNTKTDDMPASVCTAA